MAARTSRITNAPSESVMMRVSVWLAVVAAVCSTTVGRLWVVPGLLLITAACATLAACGWRPFRSELTTHWLRGLLGMLGAFELLMAASAAPITTIAAGMLAGAALIAAAALATPSRRLIVSSLVAATLPFAIFTWWAIVPPVVTIVAFAIGIAATRSTPMRSDDLALPPTNLQPVG